jgi:hypothetical protein
MLRTELLPANHRRNLHAMNSTVKIALIILGALAAILILSQLVMGQIILSGPLEMEKWRTRHQHTGYMTAVVTIVYVGWSLMTIAALPSRPKA